MRKHESFKELLYNEPADIIREIIYDIEMNDISMPYTCLIDTIGEEFFYGNDKKSQAIKLYKWYKTRV